MALRGKIHGFGINDAPYSVKVRVGGRIVWRCPYFTVYSSMLNRCYGKAERKNSPTYEGCYVVPEWNSFMKFKEWMETQDWQNKQMDKDLLIENNREYGPNTCVFISRQLNMFLTDSPRGKYLVGVMYEEDRNKFKSRSREGGKAKFLGRFNTELEAHQVYWSHKQSLALEFIKEQDDKRVIEAIKLRYGVA